MLGKKNIFSNKKIVYFFYFLILIVSFFLTITYALVNFFHKEKPFSKNFKIGKSTGEILLVDCKADSTTFRNELLSLNEPFINETQQTYTAEETHIVKIDTNQTKNKHLDLLNKYRWLSINYKIFLLSKDNNSNNDLMIINTKKGQDITTTIYDDNSPNNEKECTIFPVSLTYAKMEANNTASTTKTFYVDSTGKLHRPEMYKKKVLSSNDEYLSYEVLVQLQSNITLNKESLKDFFESYNKQHPNARKNYSDYANDDDTPTIKIIMEYDLVDEHGNENTGNISRRGSTGMKLPTQATNTDKKGDKVLLKIVNLEQNKNIQSNTISN
ncbi:hypothetical protein [Candidatus Phytoplasma palmae]|uniref:hypothetical protein n=1 Tax=Candidatus Phytoplasma palmae TaxID=85624 RepID=UPI003990604F